MVVALGSGLLPLASTGRGHGLLVLRRVLSGVKDSGSTQHGLGAPRSPLGHGLQLEAWHGPGALLSPSPRTSVFDVPLLGLDHAGPMSPGGSEERRRAHPLHCEAEEKLGRTRSGETSPPLHTDPSLTPQPPPRGPTPK